MSWVKYLVLLSILLIPQSAYPQSSGGFIPSQILTAAELNAAFQAKTDYPLPNSQIRSALALPILVTDTAFGAVCDGAADDTTAINNALASASTGQTVLLPFGKTCRILNSINIGNGSSSAASTVNGVILGCQANPVSTSYFGGMSATTGCRLFWGGGPVAAVINVLGPIQGWGIQNIYIDCTSVAAIGVKLISAQGGEMRNTVMNNCLTQGLLTNSVPQGSTFGDSNTESNGFYNNLINVPNHTNAIGIQLTGQVADTTSNTSHNLFVNTKILMPSAPTTIIGIDLQDSDSDVFVQTTMFGGGSGCTAIAFDYGSHNVWPSSDIFYGIDPGSNCTTSFLNSSTPNSTAKPNYIIGLVEANGASAPVLNNLAVYSSHNLVYAPGGNTASTDVWAQWSPFTPSPSCGNATLVNNSARSKTTGKITFIQFDLSFSAIGTTCSAANNITFTVPQVPNSNATVVGRDIGSTAPGIECSIIGGTTTATCSRYDGSIAWTLNDRFEISGMYENQ